MVIATSILYCLRYFDKPLLPPSEPVRLTPAWEESNLPNDELNFKGVTMENADLETNPPRDRWKLVYLTLLLHGVGTLMPWNMFITAKAYFVDYKLGYEYTGENSEYATNFLAYIGLAAQAPNIMFNWLNIFINIGGNLTTRIVWSLLMEVIAFVFTVALVMIDSSTWPGLFFSATMGTVVFINMANGIYQNTVYGMAAKLPPTYTGAVVLGSNVSGAFTAIINIISLRFSPNARTAAIYYFITALFVLLACFDTYFALPLNVSTPVLSYTEYGDIYYSINIISLRFSPNARTAAIYYFITALFVLLACFDTYFALPLNVSTPVLSYTEYGDIYYSINIISLRFSPNARTAAIYYFITALFVLLACFDTYFALPLNVSTPVLSYTEYGDIYYSINIISLRFSPNARTAAIYYFITALFVLLACFDTYFALPLNVSTPVLSYTEYGDIYYSINIISLRFSPNARTAAIYYFITALFVLLACFDTYFALPLNRFYRYHEMVSQKQMASKKATNSGRTPKIPYWKIFKQTSPQLFNVFFIFFVTLSIFPAVHSDVKKSSSSFFISDKYYVSVLCFLTFNVTAMIGASLSSLYAWPGKRTLVIPVVLRAIFIPAFLLCNYHPKDVVRSLPVLITDDYAYWTIAVLMGLSSGYLSSLAMMYCPRMVEPQHAATAGMFGAACLITGVGAGIGFSFLMPWLVANVSLPAGLL
ncbi:hypothetical protein M8J76_001008 [Diaphorina citri]|nr:hypothetical protein M8J76_001008 [Diaphorina citri]